MADEGELRRILASWHESVSDRPVEEQLRQYEQIVSDLSDGERMMAERALLEVVGVRSQLWQEVAAQRAGEPGNKAGEFYGHTYTVSDPGLPSHNRGPTSGGLGPLIGLVALFLTLLGMFLAISAGNSGSGAVLLFSAICLLAAVPFGAVMVWSGLAALVSPRKGAASCLVSLLWLAVFGLAVLVLVGVALVFGLQVGPL